MFNMVRSMSLINLKAVATHLVAAAIGAAGLHYGPGLLSKVAPEGAKNMKAAQRMKQRLADGLKDPESMRLADTYLSRGDAHGKPLALCGTVNARNSMGGYVGARRFIVTEDMGPWFDNSDGDKVKELGFVETWITWCTAEVAKVDLAKR